MATIILDSNSPEKAGSNGGAKFSVIGEFTDFLGLPLRVHVGSNGDKTDPECYSGVPGQGTTVYPTSATELRCFLPVLPSGGPYSVFVRRPDDSSDGVLATSITIYPEQYFTKIFDLRSVFPRFYRMGPRSMDLLEPLP